MTMEITYTPDSNGILYPNLSLPEEPTALGVFAMRRKKYLQEYRPGLFSSLILRHEVTQQCSPFLLYSALVRPRGMGATNISTGPSEPHEPNPSTKSVCRTDRFSSYSLATTVSINALRSSSLVNRQSN